MPAQKPYHIAKVSLFTVELPAPWVQTAKLSARVLAVDKRFDPTKTGFGFGSVTSKTIRLKGSTVDAVQQYRNGTGNFTITSRVAAPGRASMPLAY